MPFFVFARVVTFTTALQFAVLIHAHAQTGVVDCGNGHFCPRGNACLVGGLCAPELEHVPGAVRTSTGDWCDPGFVEHKYRPGSCVPRAYAQCKSGMSCPPGSTCSSDGATCEGGGPPATGPMCGGNRCMQGRICSSRGTCMNPEYFHDCGNGTICSKSAACEHPKGCVYVGPQRTRQIKR